MDISIKQLSSYVLDPKTDSLRRARAKEIVDSPMTVTEKIDGTKLTIVRTDVTDKADYTKNWIVAYKGTVLYPEEFNHLGDKDSSRIEKDSIGISQYSIVFNRLKSINNHIHLVPINTELSIEFAQNKETLTRTYEKFGSMFLRSFATVKHRVIGGNLHTHPISAEQTKPSQLKRMADIVGVETFPILFSGPLSKENVLRHADISKNMANVNWEDSTDVVVKFSQSVLQIPSILGGKLEGVVIQLADGRFFKVVQSDQYNKDVRDAKKDMYRMSPEETTVYFRDMRKLITSVLSKIGSDLPKGEQISKANDLLSKIPISSFPSNSKRNETQIRDDAHETVRLMVDKRSVAGSSDGSIGLIPIAGKPLHIGHWKLIELASKENDKVVVYTTDKDRSEKNQFPIKGKDFVYFWHDHFMPILPKNVLVKFTDSPVRSVFHEIGWFEQKTTQDNEDVPTVRLYSDSSDVDTNFSSSELSKFPSMSALGKIEKRGVDRSSTVNISGTKMREFLSNGDHDSFIKYLPPIPEDDKEDIWNTLQKNAPKKENRMKDFINEVISSVYSDLITESGSAVASVDPKTPKTVNGKPATADTKLKIVDDGGKNVADKVSTDVKNLVRALNSKVHFWKDNNPYIENGYIFNGSSQHLIDPKTNTDIEKYKSEFGDIDVIVPKSKLDQLKAHLDSMDDNSAEWSPLPSNKVSNEFHYIGRTKSGASIPDQVVSLFYYTPKKQIVQVDFEGDDMTTDQSGFEKPSDWTKFSKGSPYNDLQSGIKGLAGIILIRTLIRSVTRLGDVVVLTPTGAKRVEAGNKEITDKDVSKSDKHALPATHTFNPAGGARLAYKLVGQVNLNGKPVTAYKYIEAKDSTDPVLTQLDGLFKMIFNRQPSSKELTEFRSFKHLLLMMKKYLDSETNKMSLERFIDIIGNENISAKDLQSILNEIKLVFSKG